MSYSREDYPRGDTDSYPWVPSEGDECYYGTYAVTVEEVDVDNRRAYVSVNKADVGWEGYVALYHLSEEESERDSYPFEE